jgi:L-lactate utilization protein LutC
MSKAMKEMTENIVKLNAVLDKTFKEAERKESHKCKTVIDLAFRNFASRISQDCEDIITHNNIEKNKEFITDNITKLVSTEYYKLYSILSSYEINEVNVATKLKEEWIKEVANSVINIIYDGQDSISRITQLNNRLMIHVGDYSTYINNKTFNT